MFDRPDNEHLLELLDSHLPVSLSDGEGTILHINEAFCRLSGYDAAELIGRNHRVLGAGTAPQAHFSDLYRTLGAGETWRGEFENRRRDGEPFWLQATVLTVTCRTTGERRHIMFGIDISARERQRRAYEALVNPGLDVGIFTGIARIIADGLACRSAGIGRLVEGGTMVEVVGAWANGMAARPLRYALTGTPCAHCLAQDEPIAVFDNDVQAHFPDDDMLVDLGAVSYRGAALRDDAGRSIGILFAIDDLPCADDPDERAFLKTAAARASVELMRASAAEQLRVNEERMRLTLEAGDLGYWEWDFVTGTATNNARMAEMRGYAADEFSVTYEGWRERIHPDDRSRVVPLGEALLAGRIPAYDVDYRVRTKTGDWRWVNTRAKAIAHDRDGRALRVIGVQSDIHARRMAEEVERENRQWLELAVDAADLGVWRWDMERDRISSNERYASMLGFSLEEMPTSQRDALALVHPDDVAGIRDAALKYLRGEVDKYRSVYRMRGKDGQWRWVANEGRVTEISETGRALRSVGVQRDISQLHNAEAALRESEARLRTIVDNSPIGIFLCAPDGLIVFRNAAIENMCGTNACHTLGEAWVRLVHEEDRSRVVAAWRDYLAAPSGILTLEWRLLGGSDGDRQVSVRVAAIREDDSVLGFAGTIEDITERTLADARERQLLLQLQQTQKIEAIGQLTGGIAHDFNNSLAAILGFANLSLPVVLHHERLRSYLDSIIQAAEHSRELVQKMLEFSRHTPTRKLEAIDARPILRAAGQMLQSVIPATMQVAVTLDDEVEGVLIDSTDLNQILLNLALNARDAIVDHGRIEIRLGAVRANAGQCAACHRDFNDSFVELCVSDDGCGIPAEVRTRIFDPFFSTKDVGKGTGMGLSVVHGIVHRAGGHVLVETAESIGTRIRVLLRAAPLPDVSPRTERAPDAAVSGHGYRIAVVDDELAIVEFIGELLRRDGYEVVPFVDPVAARLAFDDPTLHFDALVTDQTMPGLTGLELTERVRVHHPDMPIFICTGLIDRIELPQAAALGVTRVFLKPLPLAEFLAALGGALIARRANPVLPLS